MRRLILLIIIFVLFGAVNILLAEAGLLAITYQRFERGYMVWRADVGNIWVLADNGQVLNFRSVDIQRLGDNQITAPPGLRAPIMGFGKVWGNSQLVRDLLGYAIADEASATANYEVVPLSNVIFLAFANVTAQIEPNGQWISGALNSTIQVTSLTSSSNSPRVNDTITINWSITRGQYDREYAKVEFYDATGALVISQTGLLNASTTFVIPNTTKITVVLWAISNTTPVRLAYSFLTLNIAGSGTTATPTPAPTTCVSGSTYVVQRGDTLSRIARRCGITVTALATRNNIVNRNRIFVGQQLIIP